MISLAVGLVVWEVLGRSQPILLDTPGHALTSLVDLTRDGTLPQALGESGLLYVIGLATATVFGVGYGLLLARAKLLKESTEWLMYVLQAVPIVGVTPFILAGLGFGVGAKSLVTEGKEFPDGALIMGSPAKVVRMLTTEQIERLHWSAAHYVAQARRHRLAQQVA